MIRHFIAAMRFLTVIPIPGKAGTGTLDMAGAAYCFPLVGAVVGGLSWLVAVVAARLFPHPVPEALVVLSWAVWSGGLHLDGLADTADGLLGSQSRERALEIMRDSRVGSMGVLAVVFVLGLKFAALSGMEYGELPMVAFIAPVVGRCSLLPLMALLPYARSSGMGNLFASQGGLACVWAVVGVALMAFVSGRWTVLAAWLVGLFAYGWWLRYRLGGCTGDTYGAASEIGEALTCLAMAVHLVSA